MYGVNNLAVNRDRLSLFISPRTLFTANEQGFWYDLTNINTLYQDSLGRTPVTADSDPVGLMLDSGHWDGRGVVNLALQTSAIASSPWAFGGSGTTPTIASNSTTAPDGTLTADTLTLGATPGTRDLRQTVVIESGEDITVSWRFKYNGFDWVRVAVFDGTNGFSAWVNINTGTIGTSSSLNAGTLVSASVTEDNEDFYLITLSGDIGTATDCIVLAYPATADNSTTRANSGSFIVWGLQVESGLSRTDLQQNEITRGGPGNHASQATDADRPIYKASGGKFWFALDGTKDMDVLGTQSLFNFMHNGTGGTALAAMEFGTTANPDAQYTIYSSSNGGSAYNGFFAAYDDRASATNTDAFRVVIANASSNFPVPLTQRVQNILTAQEPKVVRFDYDGDEVNIYENAIKRGVYYGRSSPSSGNADSDLRLFRRARDLDFFAVGKFYGGVLVDKVLPASIGTRLDNYFALISGAAIAYPTYPSSIDVFLVAGQSNAEGRVASSLGPVWIQDNLVDGVSVFNSAQFTDYSLSDFGANGNGTSWVQVQSYNNFSFAHIALKEIADEIGAIVACSITSGGTPLGAVSNARGSWNADYSSIPADTPALLEALEQRYSDLVALCASCNITLNVKALIWHQGEHDEVLGTEAAYATNWAAVVAKFRSFTGNATLPVIYGTVPATSLYYSSTVRAAQLAFAASDANAYCRDNDDLTMFDSVHFDAASCSVFGEWAATTYLTNY